MHADAMLAAIVNLSFFFFQIFLFSFGIPFFIVAIIVVFFI